MGAESVLLRDALGRVLAGAVTALVDLPGVDTVAMDGWAVCGSGPWAVVGASPAGAPAVTLDEGQAVEVATGSQCPAGATAVVRAEDGQQRSGQLSGRSRSCDVRPRGEQCSAGQLVLPAGTVLRPPALGLAAAVGVDRLEVLRRPRVAAVILGDEVIDAGLPAAGQVRDAIGPQLAGWVQLLGGELLGGCAVPDDLDSTTAALAGWDQQVEIVVVTGGTSAGRGDHLRPALAAHGATALVDGVDVRPGHPMLLYRLPSGTLVVGLPGNPLAAVVALATLLWPLLDGFLGRDLPPLAERGGRLAVPSAGTALVPCAVLDGQLIPVGHAGSAMLRGVAVAAGLAVSDTGGRVRWLAFPWS